MKYTFVNESGHEQTITIPDDYITSNCVNLGISKRAAIEMYLSDEGYIINDTVAALTEKAAANSGRVISGERKKRSRKPDLIKRAMVESLRDFVASQDGVRDCEITNPERVVRFSLKTDTYELTLSRKRKPKD